MDVAEQEQRQRERGTACGRCASPLEPGDLRCPLCALAIPLAARHRDAGADAACATVVRCDACGAAVRYVAEAQAPRCVFCGAVTHVEQPQDPIEQAECFVPFAIGPDAAQAALRAWLGSLGFFRPSDLAQRAAVEGLRPLWWAAWVVDADALVSWTADSNAGSGRSQWAPHAGQTGMSFQTLVVSASRGLSLEEAARLVPGYAVAMAKARPEGPAGAVVEGFELQRSAARRVVLGAIESTAAARVAHGCVPGSRTRHVRVAVMLRGLTTRRMGLPAYIVAYRYGGTVYRAIVHGQDARGVVGTAPYSWWKILGVAAGIAAAVAIVALVVGAIAAAGNA